MMTLIELGQIAALVLGAMGTATWIQFTFRSHERLIKEKGEHLAALEEAMPNDLKGRLAYLERHELTREEHAEICALMSKGVKAELCSLKKLLEQQNERLAKGDEMFMNLSRLAGQMEHHLKVNGSPGRKVICPFAGEKGGP